MTAHRCAHCDTSLLRSELRVYVDRHGMLRSELRGYVDRHGTVEQVCWTCYAAAMNPELHPRHRRSDMLINASLAAALIALAALVMLTSGTPL